MTNQGAALMGIGAAGGDERAKEATKRAISSPLLEVSIDGAEHVLVNVTGGKDLSMTEAEDASSVIRQAANTNVDITFGMAIDETLNDEIRVTVIATGIDKTKQGDEKPVEEVSQPAAQPVSQAPVQHRFRHNHRLVPPRPQRRNSQPPMTRSKIGTKTSATN